MADEEIIEVVVDGPGSVVVTPQPITEIVEVDYGTKGPKGDRGEPGPPGAGSLETLSYVYVQATPESVWMITHPLQFVPTVTVVDTAGTEQIGSVTYVGSNTIILTFGRPFSGTAYLS